MIKLPNCQSTKGFSLVELMIVVSIMAVLAVIALTIYADAQKTSRDSRRKADMTAVGSALESRYGSDGNYPVLTDDMFVGGKPKDPGSFIYTFPAAGATFNMCAQLEKATGNYCDAAGMDYAQDGCSSVGTTAKYFCVKNRQ